MFFNRKSNTNHSIKLENQLPSLICEELRSLLLVIRPFGLVPFSLKTYQSSARHSVMLGLKGTVIGIIILAAICFGPLQYMRKPMESLLFTIVHYLIMYINLICVGCVYIRCVTQRDAMVSILRRLQIVIFHLKTLGIYHEHELRHVRRAVISYTIMFYVNIILSNANLPILFKNPLAGILFTTANVLASFIVFLIELQYIILFYGLYRKFLLLNHTFSQAKTSHYKQLVIIHNRLCDLCYEVNSVFDLQILIVITSHFTYIICNIYYIVIIFIEAMHGRGAISKHIIFITLIVYWCVYKSAHLVWMVCYATKTQNEGNITHTFVQKRGLQYFGQLLARQNINLTVCGLFPLDFTLLYTIVGTATTYWIILIQLQFLIPQQIPAEDNPGTNTTTS